MLLPFVKIRMHLLDQIKIGWSVAGGVGTTAWKAFTMAMISPWAMAGIFGGFAGAFAHGVSSFFSSKARYIHTLTTNLYLQNLANNGSMLAYLVDAAETEESNALLLAYFILYVERNRDFTQDELDERVEGWLKSEFGLDVDFGVSDAVARLVDKELMIRRQLPTPELKAREGILKVYDLPSALRRLDEAWDGCYSYNGAHTADEDRLADKGSPAYPASVPRGLIAAQSSSSSTSSSTGAAASGASKFRVDPSDSPGALPSRSASERSPGYKKTA
jgi:hypothetical protein